MDKAFDLGNIGGFTDNAVQYIPNSNVVMFKVWVHTNSSQGINGIDGGLMFNLVLVGVVPAAFSGPFSDQSENGLLDVMWKVANRIEIPKRGE